MDAEMKEATFEHVVLAHGVNHTAPVPQPAALASGSNIGYRLKLQDCVALASGSNIGYRVKLQNSSQEMERALDINGAAGCIVGELLLLDPSQVWASVRQGAAACLKKYVDDAVYPKGLRPESADARKGVVRCMRDELKDL